MDIDIINHNLSGKKIKNLSETIIKKKEQKELKQACQGFEAIFLRTMLKSMRATLPKDNIFGQNHGMDIYKSMYDQHLADKISKGNNSVGIGNFLYKHLEKSLNK
ncbi:MAG: flagellar biosynthesis protein FlgJ [Desulfobacteraceae bacterium 4572_130]|nr:MAG: flagellar biosynthesis protein FlgJ [Desulfobacteraceae bacterium 4572_130]